MNRVAFSNLAAPSWSIERCAEAVHELDFDGLELRLLDGEPIDALTLDAGVRRRVRAALTGVQVPCLDTSIRLGDPGLTEAIELAAEWGARAVRVFGGLPDSLDDELNLAEEVDVMVLLETHDEWSNAQRVARMLQRFDSSYFAALWDIHHPFRLGDWPQDVLHELRGRIALVHVKDARRDGNDWQLVELGEGDLPVEESIDALVATGYHGWFTIEWEKRWHPELAEAEDVLPRELAKVRALLE